MKELQIFDALTDIDDAFLLEAHEPATRRTARFGGFRRAAVLIAAVMMLVVTAVAAGGEFGPFYEMIHGRGLEFGYETIRHEETDTVSVEDCEYTYTAYTTHSPDTAVASLQLKSNETLEVIYEGEILLPDGTVERKRVTNQGTNRVTVFLTNDIDGVDGIILKTRVCFVRISASGKRSTITAWQDTLREEYYQLAPEGYSSDWQDMDSFTGEPKHAKAVLPEGSDVVVVIPDRDE